jgi:hypothetical protein
MQTTFNRKRRKEALDKKRGKNRSFLLKLKLRKMKNQLQGIKGI